MVAVTGLAFAHVRASPRPERWRVDALMSASLALAGVVLVESFLDLWLARGVFGLSWHQTLMLIFLMLVSSGQATVYVVRNAATSGGAGPSSGSSSPRSPTLWSCRRWPSAVR